MRRTLHPPWALRYTANTGSSQARTDLVVCITCKQVRSVRGTRTQRINRGFISRIASKVMVRAGVVPTKERIKATRLLWAWSRDKLRCRAPNGKALNGHKNRSNSNRDTRSIAPVVCSKAAGCRWQQWVRAFRCGAKLRIADRAVSPVLNKLRHIALLRVQSVQNGVAIGLSLSGHSCFVFVVGISLLRMGLVK